jgi:MGT family glycosyltransferase
VSGFLFVVPPLTGHVNPTVAVGAELAARGHDVAWAGHGGLLRQLLPAGARIVPVLGDELTGQFRDGGAGLRGFGALKFLWEGFIIPLARQMLPGVEAAIAGLAPDVVVADQQALAGAVAARRLGVTWATSATTPSELLRPLAAMPKVEQWISDQMTALQLANGLRDTVPVDLRFADRLVLVFTTAALLGDTSGFGPQFVFPGPALSGRPDHGEFPWDWLDPERRHLLVSLGTVSGQAGTRFYQVAVEALAGLGAELQVVMVGPPMTGLPPHIMVAERVPQLALLPHLAAVVSHGGHNTVCESLAHGLPLVVTPIRDDQTTIAQLVADAGAGIRLRFARLTADDLRGAVRAVLDDPAYRAAAGRVRDSFAAAGGARAAADHLEKLL